MVKGQDEIKLKLCDILSTQSKHRLFCMFTVSNADKHPCSCFCSFMLSH